MTLLVVLGTASVLAALGVAVLHHNKMHRGAFVCKILASLLFCAEGLVALLAAGRLTPGHLLFVGALVFALLGDVLLAQFALVKREYNGFLYIVGGGCFLFGHLLYVAWFLQLAPLRPAVLLLAALVPLVYFILEKAGVLRMGGMALPVYAYALALGCMLAATLNLALAGQGGLALCAGALFTLSDSCLFLQNHGNERVQKARQALSFLVILAYYIAQAVFAALPAVWG